MNKIRTILSMLAGAGALIMLFGGCYFLGLAHAQAVDLPAAVQAADPAPPELPWEAWFALAVMFLGSVRNIVRGATEIVGWISRRTATTKDDDLYRRMDRFADQLDAIAARLPLPGTGTSVHAPVPRKPQSGRVAWSITAALAGIALGAWLVVASSCATVERGAAAGKHAALECGVQHAPSIASLLARFGAIAALGGYDRKAFETAGQGAALGVLSCAYGEFLREYQRLGKDQPAARALVATSDPVVELQELMRQASGGAPVRLADGTVMQ